MTTMEGASVKGHRLSWRFFLQSRLLMLAGLGLCGLDGCVCGSPAHI